MNDKLAAALITIVLLLGAGASHAAGVTSQQTNLEASTLVAAPTMTTASGVGSTTNASEVAFYFWFLSIGQAECSLVTGVCSMTVTNQGNDSSYDVALATNNCNLDLISARNDTATTDTPTNGTVGGQVTNGIPHGANVTATCTASKAQLTLEPNGWLATGFFTLKLINSLESYPPGKEVSFEFEGTWTAPVNVSISTGTFTYVGRPNLACTGYPTAPCLWVTYKNNANYTFTILVSLVLRNTAGQTIYVGGNYGPMGGYWNTDFEFSFLPAYVPDGNYIGHLFVTSNGVALSTTTEFDITIVDNIVRASVVTTTTTATTTAIPEFPSVDLLLTLTVVIVVGLVLTTIERGRKMR